MTSRSKVFNDCVHGHIELDPLCVAIIDTPQFQRLRHIKQMGACYYVYPGASHNRFEHCIGVCHLAGQLIETLMSKQQDLEISKSDVNCLKIAGLCHDLGHGPFSHVFDGMFMPKAAPSNNTSHEELSKLLFAAMLEETPAIQNQLSLNEQIFIKDLIDPKTDGEIRKSLQKSRKVDMTFLYEEEKNVYSMFYTRNAIHQRASHHVVKQAVEYMLMDALLKADKHLEFYGKNDEKKRMSTFGDDMVAFSQMTDNVYHQILHGEPRVELRDAADILRRIERRDLYRCICETKPRRCSEIVEVDRDAIKKEIVKLSDREIVKSSDGEIIKLSDGEIVKLSDGEIVKLSDGEIVKLSDGEIVKLSDGVIGKLSDGEIVKLAVEDFEIMKVKFDYGKGENNPVKSVHFYKKDTPNEVLRTQEAESDAVTLMLPSVFCEVVLRFFLKKRKHHIVAHNAIMAWMEKKENGWEDNGKRFRPKKQQ